MPNQYPLPAPDRLTYDKAREIAKCYNGTEFSIDELLAEVGHRSDNPDYDNYDYTDCWGELALKGSKTYRAYYVCEDQAGGPTVWSIPDLKVVFATRDLYESFTELMRLGFEISYADSEVDWMEYYRPDTELETMRCPYWQTA